MEEHSREIFERLRILCVGDDPALGKALSRLVLLGDLRRAGTIIEKEIRDMPIQVNIEENPILMRHRYGVLPETAVAAVLAAQPAELDLWADAIFEVDSPADLLARRAGA